MKWEKLGDLALLPHSCMTSASWPCLIGNVWQLVCTALGVQRLARQAPIADTGKSQQTLAQHPLSAAYNSKSMVAAPCCDKHLLPKQAWFIRVLCGLQQQQHDLLASPTFGCSLHFVI